METGHKEGGRQETGSLGRLPATVIAEFGACSRQGSDRSVNEDHYAILRLSRHQDTLATSLPRGLLPGSFDEYGYAMVVADGLGGKSGEEASRLAIATLVHLAIHFGKWNLRINDDDIAGDVMDRVERFYRYVDTTLTHESALEPGLKLQTTLTATFGAGRDLFFAHLGHSRAYLYRGGTLMRLTRDHTVGRQFATAPVGPIIDVNHSARDLHHILTDALGMTGSRGPVIDLERIQLDDGDRVLVCTNGLTDALDEPALTRILSSNQSPDDQARALVDAAGAAGATDDATALVALYHLPEQLRQH